MADIDCAECGAAHEVIIQDGPFELYQCSCGVDLTDMANTCCAIVHYLIDGGDKPSTKDERPDNSELESPTPSTTEAGR